MSNFLIFKAAFNNSATPAIGTYTAEGATARFNRDTSISPDYYLYNTADGTAVQWFVPTKETTDFEFVADILTRDWSNRVTYFIIADSTGTTRLRMWSQYDNWDFENSDSVEGTGDPEYIGTIRPSTSGGFGVFHQFRVRVRKLTASSSGVEVYVDGALKLTATAGAALVTCAKIGFVGGVGTFGPGTDAGIKNAYVYDLSGGDVIDRGVLSGAFNRFISWMKSKFALKSDIPTVNNATLTIQRNGTNVQTFTANQSTNATANITVPTAVSELTNDSGYLTSSSNLDASKLTSGTVDIERLPQGALERLIKVANEAARYALTTADVQLGDTVQQLDTGIMYVVTDTDHLDSAAGYTEYTAGTAASVPWSGVTGKPTFAAVATSGAYSDLTGTPTIPTVNDATLTIQQNGTNVQTFTANASTNATANIQCVDLTNNQTVAGNKEFTGTTTAHDVIPSATDTYNFGSPSYQWNNAYIKSLTINGVACGDILTHNASEFVDLSSNQTIDGVKNYTSNQQMKSLVINPTGTTRKEMYGSTEGVIGPYGGGTVPESNINPYRFYIGKARNYASAPIIIDTNMLTSGSTNIILRSASNESENALDHRFYVGTSVINNDDGTKTKNAYVQFYNTNEIRSNKNNYCQLGTASYKWADVNTVLFNGINPGALSLPDLNSAIDISGYLDTSQSSENTYTPPSDGYISIFGRSATTSGIVIKTGSLGSMGYSLIDFGNTDKVSFCMCPVFKNQAVTIWLKSVTSLDSAKFFPCQGNV